MATRRTRMNVLSQQVSQDSTVGMAARGAKRQPEHRSPNLQHKKKRTAFGDITNRGNGKNDAQKRGKKAGTKGVAKKGKDVIIFPKSTAKTHTSTDTTVSGSQSGSGSQSERGEDMSWEVIELSQSQGTSSSQEASTCSQSSQSSTCSDSDVDALNLKNIQLSQNPDGSSKQEESWEDIDCENLQDTNQVALYAHDIFLYYKERELTFPVRDYMNTEVQPDLTPHMRAILVDWLVEVQENFELNHETLYLAVKLTDHYLSRQRISREKLQLVGATALFVACKFDERCPPVVDDFLYICDDAYKRDELLATERHLVRTVGFDIGFPLSYRFLRRYAKCARVAVDTLTLGRYLLESSLLDYANVTERDSRLAAACLLLAMELKQTGSWSGTLVHYTGYRASELSDLVRRLNTMLAASPSKHLNTIRTKYSHQVFHQVAKTPALSKEALDKLIGSSDDTSLPSTPSQSQ